MSLIRFAICLLLSTLHLVAADVPFDLDGALEGATVDNPNLFNSGGTISVNGWTVKVPKNLQIGFPAAFIPWRDFVASLGSFGGYQITVVGNVLPTLGPVAAQVYISQFFTEFSSGFISKVNTDGTLETANGPIVRLNDPNAVYSSGFAGNKFMTADDQNPSIGSFSGFPMCIPRNATDPLCPSSNRPNIPGTAAASPGSLQVPNPLVMAPFMVGDYIEYSGYRSGREIIVYSVVATNILLTTTGNPAYIRMEVASIGVFTADTANQEQAITKFVGFTSDPAANSISISRIEIDICTGNTNFVEIATGTIKVGVRNKFDIRFTSPAGDKYTREYHITNNLGTKLTANNILAGQFIQPVSEWIQPENMPGIAQTRHDFSAYQLLTQGAGRDADGNIWGPLDPFPQSDINPAVLFDVSKCPPPAVTVASASSTTTTSTASSTSSAAPTTIPVDTVKVVTASWTSQGGGTLAVTCSSSNTNNALVGMVLDTPTQKSIPMVASSPGVWTFSSVKVKQPSPNSITCRSKLGGSATAAVTLRKKRQTAVERRESAVDDLNT